MHIRLTKPSANLDKALPPTPDERDAAAGSGTVAATEPAGHLKPRGVAGAMHKALHRPRMAIQSLTASLRNQPQASRSETAATTGTLAGSNPATVPQALTLQPMREMAPLTGTPLDIPELTHLVSEHLKPEGVLALAATNHRFQGMLKFERANILAERERIASAIDQAAHDAHLATLSPPIQRLFAPEVPSKPNPGDPLVDNPLPALFTVREMLGLPAGTPIVETLKKFIEFIPKTQADPKLRSDQQVKAIALTRALLSDARWHGLAGITNSEKNELAKAACGLVSTVRQGPHQHPAKAELKAKRTKYSNLIERATAENNHALGRSAIVGTLAIHATTAGKMLKQDKTSNKAIALVKDLAMSVDRYHLEPSLLDQITHVLCEAPTKNGRAIAGLYKAVKSRGNPAQIDAVKLALSEAGRLKLIERELRLQQMVFGSI